MKDPVVSHVIAEICRLFGFDGLRVTWTDGRVFVNQDGKWVKE